MYLFTWFAVILSAQCLFWCYTSACYSFKKTNAIPATPKPAPPRTLTVIPTTTTAVSVSANPCLEIECEKGHAVPPFVNNTIPFTEPTIVNSSSTQEDNVETSLTSSQTPSPTYIVSYRIPWWAGVVLALGILVSILGAFFSARWAMVRAHNCHPSHPQRPQDNIKVHHINVPQLQLTPDVIPEDTPCSSTCNINYKQQRHLPIASPTKAECVIELKSYMNRFQPPCIPQHDDSFSGDDELNEEETICSDELTLEDIGEHGTRVHEKAQNFKHSVVSSSARADYSVLNKEWQEKPKHVPVFQGSNHGKCPEEIPPKISGDVPPIKIRPRVPSPPRLVTSNNIRENSLYETVGGDKHVYATPTTRPAGATGISPGLRQYVHMYEEPPNYVENGMTSATSTDHLFRPSS